MMSTKAKRALQSRKHMGGKSAGGDATSGVGRFEKLESRELLSAFQPVSASFQWTGRGGVVDRQIRIDGSGDCLEPPPEANCLLGESSTAPSRIVLNFSGRFDKKSFNLASDVSITGDLGSFQVTGGTAKKSTLTLYTAGSLSSDPGSDLTLSVHDIRGKKPLAVSMDPWTVTLGINEDEGPPPPTPPSPDTTAPRVLGVVADPSQPPSFIDALFSEDLNEASVENSANFQVIGSDGIERMPSSIDYDPVADRARFEINGLLANGSYTVRLTTGIQDVAGNRLTSVFTATFQVQVNTPPASPGDITPPVVVVATPSTEDVLQAAPGTVVAQFSEPVDPSSVNSFSFRLIASGQDGVFGNATDRLVNVHSVQYNESSRQATLFLSETLSEDAYRIELVGDGGDSIKDLAGHSLDGNRDGFGGGNYTSEFRVDTTPPTFSAALGGGSDSGVPEDNRTNRPSDVVISGTVSDGPVGAAEGLTVTLDVDGDGFDDDITTTDASGGFAVASPPGFNAAAVQSVRLRVIDRAGNARILQTTFTVDASPPVVGFASPIEVLDEAPSSLTVHFTEPMNPLGVQDLKNYKLIASGGDGQFFDQNLQDLSSYLTAADYDAPNNKVTLTLTPGLPDDSYRLVVSSGGTIEDLAGNRPGRDAVLDIRVGGLTRTSLPRPTDLQPVDPTTIRQFPDFDFTAYETNNPHRVHQDQIIVKSTDQSVDPNSIIILPEAEFDTLPLNATNNTIPTCENTSLGSTPFGQDPGEDPNLIITGVDLGTLDVDFYCFRARAGEIVKFSMTDEFDFFLPTFPTLTIWDLGTDDRPGGGGNAMDRPLIGEALFQFFQANNKPVFSLADIIPDFVEGIMTGITGNSLDNPERQEDIVSPTGTFLPGFPLGTEIRFPEDRTYALQVDADRFLSNQVQEYIIRGQFKKPATTATNLQQIIYVDFDGSQGVTGFEDTSIFQNPILVDVPAFNVRDYGYDPIFQDQFIDLLMAEMREEFERVRFQEINTGQNAAFGIQPFSYELRDSRHFPDPGQAANVTRLHVGGPASIAGLPFGVIGIAEDVDTGNQNGSNNILMFSTDLAKFELSAVAPLGFGPSRIGDLAKQLAEVASHEAGHVLGLWHTRMEGFEFCDFNADPTCPFDFDNLIDPFVPPLGEDVEHRFDRFRDFGQVFGQFSFSIGLEFFEGVADSIGTLAWGMTGRDAAPPRVLDMEVVPGQIKLVFSEGLDITTLNTDTAPTIVLERAGFDGDFADSIAIELQPIGVRGPSLNPQDACVGTAPAGVSLYDPCIATLTLNIAQPSQVLLNDRYRLTLQSTSTRGVRDNAGNLLDGEINLQPSLRLSPLRERFPSGDGNPGGSFQLEFLVTDRIGVDGDATGPSTGGTIGTLTTPFTTIQQALEEAQFANLRQAPVRVVVSPATTPYLSLDRRLDLTPLTTSDQGDLLIPADTHLELDGSADVAEALFVATPRPDDPATTINETTSSLGLIFRVNANFQDGQPAEILGSFLAPVAIPGNAGLAFDGASLFFLADAPGADTTADSVFVLDPFTIDPVTNRAREINRLTVPSGANGTNVDGLAVSDTEVFLADSETNEVLLLDKQTGALLGRYTATFNLVGGIDYDATTDTLWASGLSAGGAAQVHQLNARTGAILATFAAPSGATAITGIGLGDGRVFLADQATDKIFLLDRANPAGSLSFSSPSLNPAALAGVPTSQLVVKLLGTRIEASGRNSALIATGASIDNPVIFTSGRDTTALGTGVSSARPADWMGIAFRPESNDFASRLENVAVHFAGGPGTIIPGVTQTLSPITLFDARPSIINTEISTNAEAAIAATPDSFERVLGRSGPDLFWDVDAGVPIAGDWKATMPGDEFGLFQASTGKVFVDRDGDRVLDESERPATAFGAPGNTPVVGDFNSSVATLGDEIAVFDRSTGLWTIDLDRDFAVSAADALAVQFGKHGDLPIAGNWAGSTPLLVDKIGVFRARPRLSDSECLDAARLKKACFILDLNNNYAIDPGEDFLFGDPADKPVVGDWNGDGTADIGVYRPTGDFLLDRNGNRTFDPGEIDANGNQLEDPAEVIGTSNGVIDINDGPIVFGPIGGTPVIGDWDPTKPADEIGVVDSSLKWVVDVNGNLMQDPTEIVVQFGQANDVAVPGDWATNVGSEGDEFGVFRASNGLWFVDSDSDNTLDPSEDLDFDGNLDVNEDTNGNGQLDAGEDKDGDGRLDVKEDLDPDGNGPLQPDGVLNLNDGGFKFTPALRNDIQEFVFNNSLNAVWAKPGFQTVADAHWDDVQLPHVLTGTIEVQSLPQIGVVPTLEIEPGLIVKMGLANLSVGGFGATLLIDSDLEVDEPRVVFTSLLDDVRGPSGRRHDTNNDSGSQAQTPLPGDWGGIVISAGGTAIINGADIQYAGNLRVPFRFDPFTFISLFQSGLISPNPITLNGGPVFATITNNIIANTNNLANTFSPRTLASDIAAIGVVNADSLGPGPNLPRVAFNANPFIRGNDVSTNNGLNGLEIRTDALQPAFAPAFDFTINTYISRDTVWDDTDITHILLGTLNWDSFGPINCAILQFFGFTTDCSVTLLLRSNPVGTFDEFDGVIDGPAESLVIKMGGRFGNPFTMIGPNPTSLCLVVVVGAGFQLGWDDGAAGCPFTNFQIDSGADSVLVVRGVPGNADQAVAQVPVVFTSIRDDSIGGRGPEDTNNDSTATTPAPGDWGGIVVGAWARNFGRQSPLNGEPLTSSLVRDADIRFASTGVLMQSQSMEVSNSIIRSSRDFGLHALQGPTIADQPTGTNPLNIPREPAELQVWNTVLVANGTGIEQAGGPDNANFILESQVPRSLIVNNTLHANSTAINLLQRSGPLIMNNSITGNGAGTGITIDGTSLNLPFEAGFQHECPLLLRNLFFGLGNNGFTGTLPTRCLGGQEILGVDPRYTSPTAPDFNFRPAVGSPLVDSAVSEFGRPIDPLSFVDFFDPLWGLVNTPDRDKLGAFRRDHFGTSNIGIGQRPWLDMGAIELVDILSSFPRVVSMTPVPGSRFDNGSGPALVELTFSESVTSVGTATFFVEASGGDRSFREGNEVRLVGQVSAVAGSNGTRWIFVPSSVSSFNNFQNEIFRVTALGSGSQPIISVASGDTLDGEFFGSFPSGDGVEGGDFQATFSIGDVIGGASLFVDDTPLACPGVPRNDPNLQLFQTIAQALAAAQAGDTILVCPGVYTAPLTITVPVTLESLEGALPRKNAQGQLIVGTGTFITVTTGQPAITINNVSGQFPLRIGSTRGGTNHGFVITTSPISGPTTVAPAGIGIDVVGSAVDIEANIIISNTIGIRADSAGTSRLPNIINNLIVGNTTGGIGAGGAGIDIISRNKAAVATIVNNTVSYNQAGILLREDGQDPLGRIVATVQNNVITSNSNTGLSTVSARGFPNVFHNDAWGNGTPAQSSNFGGTLTNLPPSAADLGGNPIPDATCTPTLTICGNISVNPFFVNPVDPRNVSDRSEFFRISNFEVQSSSKLIDRAKDEGSPARDLKGRTRIVDIPGVGNETSPPPLPAPDSEPRSVDIGAFEFAPSALSASLGARSSVGGTADQSSDSAKLTRRMIRSELQAIVDTGVSAKATDDLLDQLAFQLGGSQLRKSQLKRLDSLVDDYLDDVLGD